LSDLEAYLAKNSSDLEERTGHYRTAQDLLKQVISLESSQLEICLRLATLERDEFGPAVQEAKGRFPTTTGPIPDLEIRRDLQKRYGALVDDAITNARRASEMNGNAQPPLLLLSRLLRERAVLRDTQEQYVTDMQSAKDWERQFLATGGHVGSSIDKNPQDCLLARLTKSKFCKEASKPAALSSCSRSFGSVRRPQLADGAGQILSNSSFGEMEFCRDLARAHALASHPQYAALTACQRVGLGPRFGSQLRVDHAESRMHSSHSIG
jgi:hypothetical protein